MTHDSNGGNLYNIDGDSIQSFQYLFQIHKQRERRLEMSKTRGLTIACLFLALFLFACQFGGGKDIVGRWEFGDQNFGMAYEFYDDGTGVMTNSIDPFYPISGEFTYTYDSGNDVLKVFIGGPTERTIIYLVSFESNDEITVEQSGLSKPLQFVRKPLPELPPGARARLGHALLGEDFVFIDARKLEAGWEEEFGAFTAVALTDIEMKIGEEAEEWLVTLQIEGEDDTSLYVLRKGEGRWGVIQLIMAD